jgi:FkbM family methyltransferase
MNIKDKITILLRVISKNRVYTARSGLASGLKRRGGLSIFPRQLTLEEQYLSDLGPSLTSQTIYDVGAWEGITTLFWARAVGRDGKVIVFEPNQENCERILINLSINNFNNVIIHPIGLGKNSYSTTLIFPKHSLAEGSANQTIQTSIKRKYANYRSIPILIDTLDHQIDTFSLPAPDLVKLDIEGLEADVLQGMSITMEKYKPKLLIEIHGVNQSAKNENIKNIRNILSSHGYNILHVETRTMITSENVEIGGSGHIYCE